MATVTVDVEIDLEALHDWELKGELEARGYTIVDDFDKDEIVEDVDDDILVSELTSRGYAVYGKRDDLPWALFQTYVLDDDKKLRAEVARVLRENGFHP